MKISRLSGEETVSWTIDFIYTDIESLDGTEKWKLMADATKFLRLWDTSTKGAGIYPPPDIDLSRLQKKLRAFFESFLVPLLSGEIVDKPQVVGSESLVPRALFVDDEGYLYSTRLLEGNVEEVGVANFIDAIHAITALPVNTFRKCEGCSRWFFPIGNSTRKNRRFCTRSCNLRETARRQRERIKKNKMTKSHSTEKE